MAEPEGLRIYIRYETLLAADLRAVLDRIERAYNRTDCLLKETRRVQPDDRLRIESIDTGRSVEIILNGHGTTILALGYLLHLILNDRKLYWEAEKMKWEAKTAEANFRREGDRDTVRRLQDARRKENRNFIKAVKELEKLVKRIAHATRILSVEIKFVPTEDSQELETPKRQIFLDDK